MNDLIFTRADLESQCDSIFQQRCPPIEWICNMGHPECGGEAKFQWAFARKSLVPNPVVFYLRAAALFFTDSYVFDDGACFPGYCQLTSHDLDCLAFRDIKENLLSGNFQVLKEATMMEMKKIMAGFQKPVTLDLRGSFLRGMEISNGRSDLKLFWETEEFWGYIEWSPY